MTFVRTEVDTIRLRAPVRDFAAAAGRMAERRSRTGLDGVERVIEASSRLPGGARVKVDQLREVPECAVEFSAPKVATGSNVIPLSLPATLDVAREVVAQVDELVGFKVPFEQMRVQRIDLDRDFEDVDNIGPLLSALSRLPAPNNPQTRYFPDPSRGNAATLTRGSAARWQSTLYSKEGEAQHRLRTARTDEQKAAAAVELATAAGRLRFELRTRTEVLGDRGLRLVGDLNDDELARMRREYFDRVGYGLEVSGMQVAVARVMGAEVEGLTEHKRLALIGWLSAQAYGMAPDLSRASGFRYKALARDVGVAAADLLEVATTASVRLDFDSARAVAA